MSDSQDAAPRSAISTPRCGDDRPAPSDARSRVRGRLAAAIPAMTASGAASVGSAGGVWRRFGGWGSHGIAIATFVAGGVTGATLIATLSHAPPPRIVYVDRAAPPDLARQAGVFSGPPASLAGPATTSADAPRAIRPTQPAPAAATALPATPSPAVAPPHVSRFAEERKLLDDARAGLLQGEPVLAIERLDAHRARCGDGMLAEERDAMEVEGPGPRRPPRGGAARARGRVQGAVTEEPLLADRGSDDRIRSVTVGRGSTSCPSVRPGQRGEGGRRSGGVLALAACTPVVDLGHNRAVLAVLTSSVVVAQDGRPSALSLDQLRETPRATT